MVKYEHFKIFFKLIQKINSSDKSKRLFKKLSFE